MLIRAFTDVILPILIALKPVYEYLFYLICWLFVVQGTRLPVETGFFISLTGCLGALPAFFYSTYLHSSGGGNKELFGIIVNTFMALSWIPIAIFYQSTLLGFLSGFLENSWKILRFFSSRILWSYWIQCFVLWSLLFYWFQRWI